MSTEIASPIALAQNLELLDQGIRLMQQLPRGLYAERRDEPGFRYSPGPHLRHAIDAYNCLLEGLEDGSIDYDARSREREIEVSREKAIDALERTRTRLLAVDHTPEHPLRVLVDTPAEAEGAATTSTLGREYQFLVGHTIHHYALIALILHQQGHDTGPEFGVAPSTLRYWRQTAD